MAMLDNQMVIWEVGVISNQFMAVHKAYKPTEKTLCRALLRHNSCTSLLEYDGIGVCWMSGGEVVKRNSNFRGG